MVDHPELRLLLGQAIDSVHTIIDEEHTDPAAVPDGGAPATPLGAGGSSTVYLASYRGMQKRAIKFLTLNYLSGRTGYRKTDFQSTFNRERVFLSTLAHGHIARLHDFGTHRDESGTEWQYIVTDHIEGRELVPTLEEETVSSRDAYRLVCHVLRAVDYMHSMRVLHADIKWENIRCRRSPAGPEAVVLDLGTAHFVPDVEHGGQQFLPLDPAARVRFITTGRILHAKHREYRDRVVDKEAVQALFPLHDIHAIGVLFEEIVARPAIVAKFRDEIGDEGLHALRSMIQNIEQSPVDGYYESVRRIHDDWHKLRRAHLAPVGVPELSLAAEFKYSVPTSAGREVITPRLAPLVSHKLFQRLRRVPQLEMTLMKYPGATHTRFAHSMAVLRNTRYYLAHLLNDTNFRLLAEKSDLEATILIALLHDVGHYQLSHMFEDYASNQRGDVTVGPWKKVPFDIPSDDDLFWCVMDPEFDSPVRGGYGRRIEDARRRSEAELGLEPAPTLARLVQDNFGPRTYDSMLRIHHAIYRPGTYPETRAVHHVLGAVLSSDVDADKVSYLIEDADRSGVNFGAGVDLDGLLGALRMPVLSDIRDRPTMAITQKGLAAAQSIAVSRNLMVGQVYWHHNNRAATAMIKYVIARLLQREIFSMPDYIEQTFFLEYDACLRHLFDGFQAVRGPEESNPIAGLLEGERRVYKTVFSTVRLDREDSEHISTALTKKRFDEIIQLEADLREVVRNTSGISDLKSGEVLVDVPLKERERPSGERGGRVFVYNDLLSEEGKELRSYTPFLEHIKEQHIRENRVCRVFVSPRVAASEYYERVTKEVREIMIDKYGV
ncbi:protein kinase [Actinomadura sp. NTSP31]|uniref:protein kinase domain-containing protein n=1 Tax=Actinomadura sp. NTSP31 TaxID=1735447 RepID=UPI0035C258A6